MAKGTANQNPEPGFWTSVTTRPSQCEAAKRTDVRARRLREHEKELRPPAK